jgi:hypothetical protein
MIEREGLSTMDEAVAAEILLTNAKFERNKQAVIDYLMGKITTISLEVPKVVKEQFELM